MFMRKWELVVFLSVLLTVIAIWRLEKSSVVCILFRAVCRSLSMFHTPRILLALSFPGVQLGRCLIAQYYGPIRNPGRKVAEAFPCNPASYIV